MARIPRVTQTIFAGSASNNGVFGSAQDGSKVLSNTLATLMGKPAWAAGWLSAVIGGSKFPPLEEFQALDYIETTQLAYLFQEGIPEWDVGTTYFTPTSIVKAPGTVQLFQSLVNNNLGNALPTAPASNSNWKYLCDLANITAGRTLLTGNQTYYVSSTGNDTNPGTSGSPWLTIQHAINYIAANVDGGGHVAMIQVQDTGSPTTYAANISVSMAFVGFGPNGVVISGNAVTPANVVLTVANASPALTVTGEGVGIQIQNLQIQNTSTGSALSVGQGASVVLGTGIIFGIAGSKQVDIESGGYFSGQGNAYTISGAAAIHIQAGVNSKATINNSTVTVTGTPAFSTAFVFITDNSTLYAVSVTFSGSATGVRFNVTNNGVINTNGGGANYFPGNSAGAGTNSGTAPYGLYV